MLRTPLRAVIDRRSKQTPHIPLQYTKTLPYPRTSQGDLSALVVVSIFCTSLLNGEDWRQLQTCLWGVRAFDIPGDTYSTGCRIQGHRFSICSMGNGMGSARRYVVIRQNSMLFVWVWGFGWPPFCDARMERYTVWGCMCAMRYARYASFGSCYPRARLYLSTILSSPTSRYSSEGTRALVQPR